MHSCHPANSSDLEIASQELETKIQPNALFHNMFTKFKKRLKEVPSKCEYWFCQHAEGWIMADIVIHSPEPTSLLPDTQLDYIPQLPLQSDVPM